MTKTIKKSQKIAKNSFYLNGIKDRQNLFIRDPVVASFEPFHKQKGITKASILPTFNHDKKSYTRGFKLPSEDIGNEQSFIEEYQKKIVQSERQISEILCPKPKSKHTFCGVCKKHYQDYRQHTESQQHKKTLRHSDYQQLIVEMVDKYRQKNDQDDFMDIEYKKNRDEEDIFQYLIMESADYGIDGFKFESFLWQ